MNIFLIFSSSTLRRQLVFPIDRGEHSIHSGKPAYTYLPTLFLSIIIVYDGIILLTVTPAITFYNVLRIFLPLSLSPLCNDDRLVRRSINYCSPYDSLPS